MKYPIVFTGWLLLTAWIAETPAKANEEPLRITTQAHVDGKGAVDVFLTLQNAGSRPLHHIHPMFHFHHTMSMMPMIMRLEPGQSITLKNTEHPPVLRVGRYPLIVMAQYKTSAKAKEHQNLTHTGSFFHREAVQSEVGGRIEVHEAGEQSRLKIFLQNRSSALKNVQMMLLLPPGVVAEKFQGMMGFTLRGEEEKYFEVPVQRTAAGLQGSHPVHLLIEYGEMLKHYSGEITGELRLGPRLNLKYLAPHLVVMALMSVALYLAYRRWGRRVG